MLHLHFLNVENGDCIIAEFVADCERSFGLIDCNRTSTRKSPALHKLQSLGVEELEFVCITHPDADHFTGIIDVLRHYEGKIRSFLTFPLSSLLTDQERLKKYAKKVLQLAERGDDEEIASRHLEFVEILQYAKDHFLPENWLQVSGDFDRLGISGFGTAAFYGIGPPKAMNGSIVQAVLNPESFTAVDNNEVSVAIQVNYAGRKVILGGDATNENWISHRRYREKIGASITSDVVKLPHHGSHLDNSPETLADFFGGANGGIAVISAGGRSHPAFETMDRLNELGCQRICTNLFNPSERSVRRLYNDAALESRLKHFLNVYAFPLATKPQACKGDIRITICPDGSIASDTEFNNILCACTTAFNAAGVPLLPTLPPVATSLTATI
ncbi:beta-lactamase superfamily II metal-dependent hydrolase [Rhizobium sp. SG_E_25_P2]|uniref:ComEC/Rec2 family competence protein n=1 Tax=Rhizobium sp. SG_E_25_P2 TaxID=2879942 RepID=UPI002475799E|nr:hypothetical protein [Rhizobium sp. SG_E_25_P2]MDH6266356.1 beta-lactamase superfamily II metal-dependent hydrolase [Rhizobium sp. SG_E_25_P2]